MRPEGGIIPPAPPVAFLTFAIIACCIFVQIVSTVAGSDFSARLLSHGALVPARIVGSTLSSPGDVPAFLTLVTSLFLHASWLHLMLNMTFLGWVGKHVESALGHGKFLLIYALGGIAGGLLQVAVDRTSTGPVVGASGAIAGVFATYAVLFSRRRVAERHLLGVRISSQLVSATWYAVSWIGLQLLIAVAFNTGQGGIAIWSHIGGFMAGLILVQPFVADIRS